MSELRYTSHPMLEPVNYDCDPEYASQYYSGIDLKIYNLLWTAAVATHVEGPVFRQHLLYSVLSSKSHLCLKWSELIEPGWSSLVMPHTIGDSYFNNILYTNYMIPASIPRYDKNRLFSSETLDDINFLFNQEIEICVSIKKIPEEKVCYSIIIEQMAKYKVARPSTYANRLESVIKNGLIGKNDKTLFLTENGKSILDKISKLPEEQQLNKEMSYAIENANNSIEMDHSKAGELLNFFCEKIFQQRSNMAIWLDRLEIMQ